jgi:hypothetical protein
MSTGICAIAGLALLLPSMPILLLGHHGTGGTYLMDKPPVTMKGTVTEFRFVNPHVLVYFNVTDAKAGVINWRAEGPALINWTRAGWNRNSLKAGDQVVVSLFPSRAGKPEGVLAKIVAANGKEWCCQSSNRYSGAFVAVEAAAHTNADFAQKAFLSGFRETVP